jgi:NADP-dependent 3-hydroxy acid dehydrogenase YdfG
MIGGSCVLTGATSDIGRAIALALARREFRVTALGRNAALLAELQGHFPDRIEARAINLCDSTELRQFAEAVGSDGIAALIHCAGIYRSGKTATLTTADLDALYHSNVRAPCELTQLLLPGLIRTRGHVVFINSSAGLGPRPGVGAYSATQHAMRAFADALRGEVNEQGVRVTSLYLGRTATRRIDRIFSSEGRPYDPALLLQPADIAAIVLHVLQMPPRAEITDLSVRPAQKSY